MSEKKTPTQCARVKIPKKITEKYLYNSGIYYLRRYTASVEHFRFVMMRKITQSIKHHNAPSLSEASAFLQNVINQFMEDGYLNDKSYAQGLIQSYRRRGLSYNVILNTARQKKLDLDLVKDVLEKIDGSIMDIENEQTSILFAYNLPDTIEYRSALIHAKKKKLAFYSRAPIDEKTYKKQLSSFARAGFGFDIASNILSIKT